MDLRKEKKAKYTTAPKVKPQQAVSYDGKGSRLDRQTSAPGKSRRADSRGLKESRDDAVERHRVNDSLSKFYQEAIRLRKP